MQLRELLAECERLLHDVGKLASEEQDQFELVDALARDLNIDVVQQASEVLCNLRLELQRAEK